MSESHNVTRPLALEHRFRHLHLTFRVMPAALAEHGGDWCEFFPISENVIAISIGDVCGHGIEKYRTKSALRKITRESAEQGLSPCETLSIANAFLRRHNPDESATAIFGLFDTSSCSFTFASTGHPPPLMTSIHGTSFLSYLDNDLPLGIEDVLYPTKRTHYVPNGSLLIFYTDGLSEENTKSLQGEKRLEEIVGKEFHRSNFLTAGDIAERLSLCGSNRDDIAILTLRT